MLKWTILLSLRIGIACGQGVQQEPPQDKVFFANSRMANDYFYSEAAYQSPAWIKNSNGKLPVSDKSFTPGNALELSYTSAAKGSWQARIFYRPIRGIDSFKPATHLTFWAYVESQTAASELPRIAIGDREQDSLTFVALHPHVASYQRGQWLRVSIPLKSLNAAEDMNALNTIVFRQQAFDGKEHRLYIDQLELSTETEPVILKAPQLLNAEGFEKHVDLAWNTVASGDVKYVKVYRSVDNRTFSPVGIQLPQINRYTDYTGQVDQKYYYKITLLNSRYTESPFSNVVSAATKRMTDEQLLDMVQRAHFRYYWEGAEPNSGLARENIPGRQNMVASGASGFGIMALIVGAERKFITRQQAIERFTRITSFLERTERFHGAYSHFIDGPTGKVEPFFGQKDNGGDLVETSFLVQGLLAAHQYFNGDSEAEKSIRTRIQKIWESIEWSWYRRAPDSKFLFWHWSPDQAWVIDHKLIGWNETMITYLLGIASPTYPIPVSMYYSGWASQGEEAQKYRSGWGQTKDGDHYTNGNTYYGIPLPVGVSNGGPLFFVHYSFLGPDPHKIKDAYTDYFTNNRNIARINYRYCVENPGRHRGYGADCWGLTASDGPWNYSANEPVVRADEGKMTPTGALASFPYTPEESMVALKNYYHRYGSFLWAEYGFRDAFDLDKNWCAEIFMGLNQAPVVVMIENYRTRLIWDLYMKHPDVQRGIEKLNEESAKR
jgi:hypothetical protein